MQEQIKYGVLYVKDSVLHNCFNHELISVEKSQHVLKDMDVPWIKEPIIKQVNSLIGYLDDLWIKINEKYEKGLPLVFPHIFRQAVFSLKFPIYIFQYFIHIYRFFRSFKSILTKKVDMLPSYR